MLDRHRDLSVCFLGVVKNFDSGPALSIGITGFGQQVTCLVGVVVKEFWGKVPQCIGRGDGVRGHSSVLQYRAHQLVAIDRHRESLTHAHIIHRRTLGIDQIKIGAEIGSLHVGGIGHLAIDRNFVERHHLCVVELLGTKHALLAHYILGGVEHHFIERHVVAIPIQIAFLHNNAPIQ